MSEPIPFQQLFPEASAKSGPFSLLGLAPSECDDNAVQAALHRRLARLAQHPQGSSALAAEVRLALHVAAAQLRDPMVRERLFALYHGTDAPREPGDYFVARIGAGLPDDAHPSSGSDAMLRETAVAIIAHSGGWNERAKRRLAAMLHALGRPPELMPQLLAQVQRSAARPGYLVHELPRSNQPAAGRSLMLVRQRTVAASVSVRHPLHRLAAILILISLCMSAVLLTAWTARIYRDRGSLVSAVNDAMRWPEPQVSRSRSAAPLTDTIRLLERSPRPAGNDAELMLGSDDEIDQVLERIRHSTRLIRTDVAAALEMFEPSERAVAQSWCRFPYSYTVRAQQDVTEFIREASLRAPNAAALIVERLVRNARFEPDGSGLYDGREIWRTAWSIGMSGRLRREREIDLELRNQLDAHLAEVYESVRPPENDVFWDNALAGLSAIAIEMLPVRHAGSRIVDAPLAWILWNDAVRAASYADTTKGQRVILDVLDAMLRAGPGVSSGEEPSIAIQAMLGAVDFDAGGIGRERVIAWLDDYGISNSDLMYVSRWLIDAAVIPGLSDELELDTSLSRSDRGRLRDRYARVMGLPLREQVSLLEQRWLDEARRGLNVSEEARECAQRLEALAMLAYLNCAATHRWRQQEQAGMAALREALMQPGMMRTLRGRVEFQLSDPVDQIRKGRLTDGEWASQYLGAGRTVDLRLQRLNDLRHLPHPIGPVDADVLAETAMFGVPIEVRRRAQRIVVAMASNPAVVNGLLESLPEAARDDHVIEMIEQIAGARLPSARDPAWRVQARRALVGRLIEMIAWHRVGTADHFTRSVGLAYAGAMEALSGMQRQESENSENHASNTPDKREANDLINSTSRLREVWLGEAAMYSTTDMGFASLEGLLRRHEARRLLARGPLQSFSMEQTSLAEIMSLVVALENPSKQDEVRLVLADLALRRREAEHVYDQMLAAERAMLRLWMIRFGEFDSDRAAGRGGA